MPKNKSRKQTFRPAPKEIWLQNPTNNNPSSTCDTDTSGKPSGTFKERKNDYKSGKTTSHVQDEEITSIADSNLITSDVSEVASSDAMRGVPETVADEISHSSETTSYSTQVLLPPKIERDVGYRNSSCDNNKIIHKNKGGKYRKQNDSNSAFRNQQEIEGKTVNESSFQDTTVNDDSIQVDSKSTHPDQWNVDVIPNIAPDCFQLVEKVKRPLNRDAPEFKPKSHCSGLNYQAEKNPNWGRAKESNISVQLESDNQGRNANQNEIYNSNQQNTVEDTSYGNTRDGNDNYHKPKSNFGGRGRSAQSKQYVNSNRYPQEDCKSSYSDKNQRSQQNRSYNSRDAASECSNNRSRQFNHREKKHSFEKRDSTSTHKEHGKLESPASDQNWDKEWTEVKPSHKANDLQGAMHSTSHFQNEATVNRQQGIESYSDKNRWPQQNKPNSSGDGASEGSGNRSRRYNQRERKDTFEKRDSTSTHKEHGKLESPASDQNWDKEWTEVKASHKPHKSSKQGAIDFPSHFQNEATSNKQQGIESISEMKIRDVDKYSAVKMKKDTSIQVLPKYRGSTDPRMQREADIKQQSNANWRVNSSRKQRSPSPSPQNDNSEITENQNTSLQEDEDLKYDAWSDKMSKQRKSHPETKPKHETERKSLGGRIEMSSKEDYDRSYEKTDVEYKEFNEIFRWNRKFDYVKVTEIEQDLFQLAKDYSYSLGHCVAEDLRMGSGIAVGFRSEFKQVPDLLSQRQKQGGLAVLENNNRYIYYLVTKKISTGKPTYETFWSSLKKTREHMVNHGVQKLAIPKIGCGLDRLDWDKVKYMIEFLFKDVDVEITVCNFQQMEDTPQKVSLSTRLVNYPEPLKNIDHYTIILYLSTEDGHISQEMEELDTKFNFLVSFRRSFKKFGVPIRYEIKNYILYGCIVREKPNTLFDFNSFAKCLFEIDKNNRKDKYEYLALQPVYDENDDLLHEKVITLLRYCLRKVDIYICSGKTPEEQIVNNVCNISV